MSFTDEDIKRLVARVKESEGLRLKAYRCDAGALTIGYGHNVDANPVPGIKRVGDRITMEQAEVLFEQDLSSFVWRVRTALPWVTELNAPRQAVIYDMAFNMGMGSVASGRGLLSFNRPNGSLPMIQRGEYVRAASNMASSAWAKKVKGRATILLRQLVSGEWQ